MSRSDHFAVLSFDCVLYCTEREQGARVHPTKSHTSTVSNGSPVKKKADTRQGIHREKRNEQKTTPQNVMPFKSMQHKESEDRQTDRQRERERVRERDRGRERDRERQRDDRILRPTQPCGHARASVARR